MNRHIKLFPFFLLMLSVFISAAMAEEVRIHLQLDEEKVILTDRGAYIKEAELKELIVEKAGDQDLSLTDLQIRKAVMAIDKTTKGNYRDGKMQSFALKYGGILYCVRWKEQDSTERCHQ